MLRYGIAVLSLGVILLAGAVQAGGDKLEIGAPAPKFANLPGVDGKKHSIGDFKKDVLVVCITCNHCPVAVAYEDRNISFAKKFGKQVDFVAINVNNLDADKLDKMIERAEAKGFNFPYLYDASQKIARALNARVTPEYYVFNKDRKLVYWGAMDNSNNASNATQDFLSVAVEAALSGKTPPMALTKARGCSVKFD